MLEPELERPLLERAARDGAATRPLDQTAYTQPALFALAVRARRAVAGLGCGAGAVIGHSLGEYAAACVAGVDDLEDGLRLVAARGG